MNFKPHDPEFIKKVIPPLILAAIVVFSMSGWGTVQPETTNVYEPMTRIQDPIDGGKYVKAQVKVPLSALSGPECETALDQIPAVGCDRDPADFTGRAAAVIRVEEFNPDDVKDPRKRGNVKICEYGSYIGKMNKQMCYAVALEDVTFCEGIRDLEFIKFCKILVNRDYDGCKDYDEGFYRNLCNNWVTEVEERGVIGYDGLASLDQAQTGI